GVKLDDGIDHRSSFVDLRDACQVFLAQRVGGILAGLECLLEIVNRGLVELEILLEVLLEVSLEVLEARPRRRQSIGNASRAKRRMSSRGKSRRHSVAKKVAARAGIRVDRRIELRGKGIGGHQGSCGIE